MTILIENAESLQYLTSSGRWSKNADAGQSFGTRQSALAAAKLESIGGFNVVGYFSKTHQFINLESGKGTRTEVAPA
jgi:hypothetical protein